MGFLRILDEACNLFCRNKVRLLLSIILFPLLLMALIYKYCFSSSKPYLYDTLDKANCSPPISPVAPEIFSHTHGIQQDKFLLGVECGHIVFSILTAPFIIIALRHALALIRRERSIFLKGLLLLVKSYHRRVTTYFWIALFVFGYIFLVVVLFFPLAVFSETSLATRAQTHALSILYLSFLSYLYIVCDQSPMAPPPDDYHGMNALQKAVRILGGWRLLLVKSLYFGFGSSLNQDFVSRNSKQPLVVQIVGSLLLVIAILMVDTFNKVIYTVFHYFGSGEVPGEEAHLVGTREYVEAPNVPHVDEDIP